MRGAGNGSFPRNQASFLGMCMAWKVFELHSLLRGRFAGRGMDLSWPFAGREERGTRPGGRFAPFGREGKGR